MISTDIRLPKITADTSEEKIKQIESYLFQFAEQLQYALDNVEKEQKTIETVISQSGETKDKDQQALDNFNEIKALIIKSADIINAYTESISKTLTGEYVTKTQFGEYTETTQTKLEATDKAISANFSSIESIKTDVNGAKERNKTVDAYIKAGELYTDDSGNKIYGIEIGQIDENIRFSRFTADRISFFDQTGANEIAYISNSTLNIRNAEIIGTLFLGSPDFGRYRLETTNGLAFKWE